MFNNNVEDLEQLNLRIDEIITDWSKYQKKDEKDKGRFVQNHQNVLADLVDNLNSLIKWLEKI
jgi:hypothetical protein